jgi:phage gp45-like
MKSSVLCALISVIALALLATPANAQATRTWVSGVGDDANPCSRTAPCKTFAGATSKTATGGEIDCLDPGGFGALTITKSITILCGISGNGGVLVSGTNGITVSLSAFGQVVLDGLDFEGLGFSGGTAGLNGVSMVGQGRLVIRNCSIRDFGSFGVNVAAPSATPSPRVLVQNSLITGNAGGGINVQGVSGATNLVEVLNTLIDANTTFGVQVVGSSELVLSASTLTGQPSSIIVSGGGQVISYGNNVLRNAGAPTSTLPLQ